MSKELAKVHGIDVVQNYEGNKLDTFSKLMFNTFEMSGKVINHFYYELVNKRGKVVHIIITDSKAMVQSIAHRLKLNYRLVEFTETYKDLDKKEE